jgi:RNA polymerase sigma-70 factor (ECF subfamily)
MSSAERTEPEAEGAVALQDYVKLITDHQGNLRAFVVSLMPGSPDVADVLQETNAALWQKRTKFEPGTNFLAWAFQIARYEVYRQRDRTKRLGRIVFSEKVVSLLADMEAPDDSDDSDEELMTALDGCLGKLTDTQRELVYERYTPGHSLEQHAARTGRSAGGLRIALLRIRETLKDCIEATLAGQSA